MSTGDTLKIVLSQTTAETVQLMLDNWLASYGKMQRLPPIDSQQREALGALATALATASHEASKCSGSDRLVAVDGRRHKATCPVCGRNVNLSGPRYENQQRLWPHHGDT